MAVAVKEKPNKRVTGWINKIKGLFPFNIGKVFSGWIPKISLWTNKSGDSASTESSVSEQNFAKAMRQPYLFTKKTLFNQYAGEAGDELLYGRTALLRDMREAVKSENGNGGTITINLNYNASDDANDMLRDLARGVQRYKMAGAI